MAYRLPSSLSTAATVPPARHQPSALPGLRQAITKPTTPNGANSSQGGPLVLAVTFSRARLASGHSAAIRASMKPPRTTSTATGEASRNRRPGWAARAVVLTEPTLRPHRSGNVTAQRRRCKSSGWPQVRELPGRGPRGREQPGLSWPGKCYRSYAASIVRRRVGVLTHTHRAGRLRNLSSPNQDHL